MHPCCILSATCGRMVSVVQFLTGNFFLPSWHVLNPSAIFGAIVGYAGKVW